MYSGCFMKIFAASYVLVVAACTPILAAATVVFAPKTATSERISASPMVPDTANTGVATVSIKSAIALTSSLSMKGGKKGMIKVMSASSPIVPYLIICSLMVYSIVGDCSIFTFYK